MSDIVAIIGANLAGVRAADGLRRLSYGGRIVLVGEEKTLPYERPPLSKELLWNNGQPPANFYLHEASYYESHDIDLRTGVRVEQIDVAGAQIRLSDGQVIRADQILLATGARARPLPLPGADAPNVVCLRTKEDGDKLAATLRPGVKVLVVGMGIIGCEVAASARKIGCDVVGIEPSKTVMVRAVGGLFGDWIAARHFRNGVDLRLNRSVTRLILQEGLVRKVELNDGQLVDCDVVVVGIGVEPALELARDAGIELSNGIVVDAGCRTSNPSVFAAGDVACQPGFFGGHVRLETYHNAVEQGEAMAAAAMGREVSHIKPCRFWTDQYGFNLQAVGRMDEHLTVVLRGDPESDAFSAFFLNDGVVEGAIAINKNRDISAARVLVERRISARAEALSDPDVSLRSLLKSPS